MECKRFQEFLHPWVDGELDLVHDLEMEKHVDGCAACLAEYAALRDLRSRLAQGAGAFPAPAALAGRLRAALAAQAGAQASAEPEFKEEIATEITKTRAPRVWSGAAAALAALLIFVSAFFAWKTRARDDGLMAELASAHVRSLQADHLFDVASSDRHTVKPWFAGKLDFSPPVDDLSETGFILVGGRMDYLDGQPAAALVYRRRLHVINLFCWPLSVGAKPRASTTTLQGFHILLWARDGFQFAAVSDVNAAELQQFSEEIKSK